MAALQIKSFGGITPKVSPRYLPDSGAQVALNSVVFNGSLQPLTTVGAAVATLTKVGTPLTIYRFGQDSVSDSNYWFHWTSDVDVCRSQVSGDTSEWTFYTGDGSPKATYAQIALSGSNYPAVSRLLGIAAPTQALTVSPSTFTPTTRPAEVYLTATMILQLTTTYGLQVSVTGTADSDYISVALSGTISASSVATAVNAKAGVAAVVDGQEVKITSDATGEDARLYVRFRTGSIVNTSGTFTYSGLDLLDLQGTGTADTYPLLVIEDSEIGSISAGDLIRVIGDGSELTEGLTTTTLTAATLATFINSRAGGRFVATAYGSCVVLSPGTSGTGSIEYIRISSDSVVFSAQEFGSESSAPAKVIVTQANIDSVEGRYLSVLINTTENFVSIPSTYTVANLTAIEGYGGSVKVYGLVDPIAIVSTTATGSSASISLRGGNYPSVAQYSSINASGVTDNPEVPETRVYTWTWVNKEAGFEFESAPAPASTSVDVRTGQTVAVSGRAVIPTGYLVTHWRLYRAVAGIYLFVGELPASQITFTDDVLAEELGEELPSLTWLTPPDTLRGLTNLPNGIMAGFTGRDIYFCDPYHPHAWPVEYNQTVDYPVVGLGRMDTTLAVLTTGTPYFIQGSHPDSMVVVKSDLEQACASKRSIVSVGGAVIYASPDGLVMLSSGGSKVITDQFFTRAQWQSAFRPSSIHAYHHDMKYVAFYDNGTTTGGFIFDLTSGQLILHTIYATAGFNDLRADKLYTTFSDRSVKIWLDGAAMGYTWRSKKFTMPQIMGFSCAQVEAEAYPVTAKVYSDGTLVHTQTVTSRTPFRLPAKPGRDWEFQIEGNTEVFAVAVAQSMEELTNG
jgi:hypothetical protein